MKPVKVMHRVITVETNLGIPESACEPVHAQLERLVTNPVVGITLPKYSPLRRPTRTPMVPGVVKRETTPPASPVPPNTPPLDRYYSDPGGGRRPSPLFCSPEFLRERSFSSIIEESGRESPDFQKELAPVSPVKDPWFAKLDY